MNLKLSWKHSAIVAVILTLLIVGIAAAAGGGSVSDWSTWESFFTPIVPEGPEGPSNPAGRPIPIPNPNHATLMAWVNDMHNLPAPALAAHAEEVARGTDHSTNVGHGPSSVKINAWATGNQLRNDFNPGPFFETFDNFWGNGWRMIPNNWGAYAYRGAESVTFDAEQVIKDESPYDGSYSMKIASSVPFEAGISREIMVKPGAEVTVEVMYLLYDHGGLHGGNVWTYDWAALGIKCDDNDAEWVNGPWHGEWLPLKHTITAGPEGRIMIFLQVISPMPENTNAYFDNVRIWVDGAPYSG